MTADETRSLREAVAGLRQTLDALTVSEGELCPGIAEAIGIDECQLAIVVGDMIWLLQCLLRVEARAAA